MSACTLGDCGAGELGLDITTNEHFQAAKDRILLAYEVQS